ncbi:hypothetical protein SDC9_169150 [bioreactor metagenome]|uniref:Uncharacterized protein n=1 Tax=bioreactor metagenome TaxID=1076179 RepID=A0A645G723_9ZZZZ
MGEGVGSSDMGHGPQDNYRFGNPHEQGAGDDRGSFSFQLSRRQDRCACASAVDSAFHGGVHGRHDSCTDERPGHAFSDTIRVHAS